MRYLIHHNISISQSFYFRLQTSEKFSGTYFNDTHKKTGTHTPTHRQNKFSFVTALDFVYQRIYFIFMLWKWRFIYMVRRSQTQLNRRWNSRRPVCMWQYWAKLEEFCGKRHSINAWKTKAMRNYVETLRLTFNTCQR